MADWDFAPYVPVAERRQRAADLILSLQAEGRPLDPVEIKGKKIATSFWGQLWCETLESYRDFESRLPRGRSYARNGAVVDLQVEEGKITAMVMGTTVYDLVIDIRGLPEERWASLRAACAGHIASVIELLGGRLASAVMTKVTAEEHTLIPGPDEIEMQCNCPDGARMCKHLAATLYGVGARLDRSPELLFRLRGVNPEELVESISTVAPGSGGSRRREVLRPEALGDIFAVELDLHPSVSEGAMTSRLPHRLSTRDAAIVTAHEVTEVGAPAEELMAEEVMAEEVMAQEFILCALAGLRQASKDILRTLPLFPRWTFENALQKLVEDGLVRQAAGVRGDRLSLALVETGPEREHARG